MNRKGLLFTGAIFVLSLVFGMGSAYAAWTTTATTGVPLIGATSGTVDNVALDKNITYALEHTLQSSDRIVLTLSGGATFAVAPQLTSLLTGDVGNGVATASTPFTTFTAGDTQVKWRVAGTSIPSGNVLSLNSSGVAIFNLSSITAAATNVNISISFEDSQATAFGSSDSYFADTSSYLFTSDEAFQYTTFTADSDVANVSESTGAYYDCTNANCVATGSAPAIVIGSNASAASYPSSTGTAEDVAAAKMLVTLSGDFSGIASVTNANITGSDSTGATTGSTATYYGITSDKSTAYGVNTAIVTSAGITISPLFKWDGTTAQTARTFTAGVTLLETGNYSAHTILTPTLAYTITRNGTSFVMNSMGSLNTLKITDTSGNIPSGGATINITAYDADGNTISEVSGNSTLSIAANYGTTTISGADLIARFASTPMYYDFAVETSSALVSNVKKTTDGTNINVYTNKSSAGGI